MLALKRYLTHGLTMSLSLGTLEDAGFTHTDIKAENVILGADVNVQGAISVIPGPSAKEEGEPKPRVTDLGLAKRLPKGRDTVDSIQAIGTPGCMSWEQEMLRECGPKQDIVSLGYLLLHMLTGEEVPLVAVPDQSKCALRTLARARCVHHACKRLG